jgi:hypothetical protein
MMKVKMDQDQKMKMKMKMVKMEQNADRWMMTVQNKGGYPNPHGLLADLRLHPHEGASQWFLLLLLLMVSRQGDGKGDV